jgi:hypothetical protein
VTYRGRPRPYCVAPSVSWALVVLDGSDGAHLELVLQGHDAPDLSVVDALARLQLLARRSGLQLRLEEMCPALVGLLELSGLCGEVAGQSERAEEPLGVEEGVDPRDPVT